MRSIHAVAAALVASAALATVVAEAAPRPPSPPVATATVAPRVAARDLPGWRLYDQRCLPCHGAAGDGHGPAAPWLWPRPRDLTAAAYKWRSTDLGDDAT
ncbi:MAG: hypothetical protein H6708_05010, partial [Kofleriaceae bacterium]|nr:hypothetical protein [Kofleriaceae bacterium]